MGEAPRLSNLQAAQLTGRSLIADDRSWLVYELPSGAFDRRSTPTLIFECEGLIRRVRNYPPEWRDLSDDELPKLSWSI